MNRRLPAACDPALAGRRLGTCARVMVPLGVIFLLFVGCASPKPPPTPRQRWESDLYYTHRLHIDGQHALAAKRFAILRKRARTPEDADEAGLVACEAQRRDGQLRPAAACLDELAKTGHSRPTRARALLHAAEIRYDDLGATNDGLKIFRALVERASDTAAGLRALSHLVRHAGRDEGTRKAAIAWMLATERAHPKSELADNLLLRAAELLRQRASTGA